MTVLIPHSDASSALLGKLHSGLATLTLIIITTALSIGPVIDAAEHCCVSSLPSQDYIRIEALVTRPFQVVHTGDPHARMSGHL